MSPIGASRAGKTRRAFPIAPDSPKDWPRACGNGRALTLAQPWHARVRRVRTLPSPARAHLLRLSRTLRSQHVVAARGLWNHRFNGSGHPRSRRAQPRPRGMDSSHLSGPGHPTARLQPRFSTTWPVRHHGRGTVCYSTTPCLRGCQGRAQHLLPYRKRVEKR